MPDLPNPFNHDDFKIEHWATSIDPAIYAYRADFPNLWGISILGPNAHGFRGIHSGPDTYETMVFFNEQPHRITPDFASAYDIRSYQTVKQVNELIAELKAGAYKTPT